MCRLGFVAFFLRSRLEESTRRAAADVVETLRARPGADGIRWSRPETFHVTLRFLGDIEPGRVPELVAQVGRKVASHGFFSVGFGALDAFPTRRQPRVVVLGLDPAAPVESLAATVERGTRAAGFELEDRPFRAHLTLGRTVRGANLQRDSAALLAPVEIPGAACEVREIVLFRSELKPSGAVHTPLERISLGAFDHPSFPSSGDLNQNG